MRTKEQAAEAASHWEALAKAQEDLARHYEEGGLPFGSVATYYERARTYRRAAQALRLEADTGIPHCSMCLGPHANHEHAHRG